ncbi:MAG: aspartate ammonia-lyase [Firmicutes bacterium]|nr:aspartate ammonia-lyase [Bacillota bacterium]
MARVEQDSLGTLEVPDDVYYGIQTLRAVRNFPVTGLRIDPELIHALGLVKRACARANREAGCLPATLADPIEAAAGEVAQGVWDDQFPVDPIQGGAGTSINMNANEVIANRALELLGRPKGDYSTVHPNTHVNMSQSTNDVVPTAFRLALLRILDDTTAALDGLALALARRAKAFAGVVKVGRTHLQDGVPIGLDQEFEAYAALVGREASRIRDASFGLLVVNIGGTAVGTGLNAPAGYGERVVELLGWWSGRNIRQAANLVDATQNVDVLVHVSAALRSAAVSLSKIASDLRLLASGPRAGLAELRLPPVQPGSSIMPGKVNPVIPELINQVAFQVQGNDLAVVLAAQNGQLELNVMQPVLMHNLFGSARMLARAARAFAERCIEGIEADRDRIRQNLERSISAVTALNPYIGYEAAARIAKETLNSGRPLREVVQEQALVPDDVLDAVLDPANLTGRPAAVSRRVPVAAGVPARCGESPLEGAQTGAEPAGTSAAASRGA